MCSIVIQRSQINLMFLALGLFFSDNSVKNMAQKCTRENSVESSRHIIVDQFTVHSKCREERIKLKVYKGQVSGVTLQVILHKLTRIKISERKTLTIVKTIFTLQNS